jgi:hypothetical protein
LKQEQEHLPLPAKGLLFLNKDVKISPHWTLTQ